jgi:hypothetical protein
MANLHAEGKKLLERYEPDDKVVGPRISQFLSHCTTKRVEVVEWDIGKMYNEIEPLLSEVEKHLGASPNLVLKVVPALGQISSSAASAAVGTMTTGAAVNFANAMFDLRIVKPNLED